MSLMKTLSLQRVAQGIAGSYISCQQEHDGHCTTKFTPHFLGTMSTMYKMYIPIHLIPFLLFKRKKFMKNPVEETKKALTAYAKSVLFAMSYTGVLSVLLCYAKRIIGDLDGTKITPFGAFFSGPALLFENSGRRQQISLFLVPKVMEAIYLLLKRRNLIKGIKNFEIVLFALAMAILGYFYGNERQNIKSNYRGALQKLLGEV